jgi:hypothetical protein
MQQFARTLTRDIEAMSINVHPSDPLKQQCMGQACGVGA